MPPETSEAFGCMRAEHQQQLRTFDGLNILPKTALSFFVDAADCAQRHEMTHVSHLYDKACRRNLECHAGRMPCIKAAVGTAAQSKFKKAAHDGRCAKSGGPDTPAACIA